MTVSATVERSCTVTASPLDFETLSAVAVTSANSVISVACTSANPTEPDVAISLDGGANPDGQQRRMVNADPAATFVPYTLSATSGGADPILPGGTVRAPAANSGRTFSVTIYGQVPPSDSYAVGSYSDTVVIEVTYSATPGPA